MISARSASLTTVLLLTSFWSDKFLSDASIFNDFVKSNLFNNGVKTKTQLDNNLRGRCELKGIVLGFFLCYQKEFKFLWCLMKLKWCCRIFINFFYLIWHLTHHMLQHIFAQNYLIIKAENKILQFFAVLISRQLRRFFFIFWSICWYHTLASILNSLKPSLKKK